MGLKKSQGNMYPWVTHTHAALGGECPHKCQYCYVNNPRFGRPAKYCGPLRLIPSEMETKLGSGRTIFKENCNDLFAWDVPSAFVGAILGHCKMYPDNTYVFQTKNPARVTYFQDNLPPDCMLGVTIETDRDMCVSKAPLPHNRVLAMEEFRGRKFVTIEPIMDLDPETMVEWLKRIKPEFVNIGADSKGHGMEEPNRSTILKLIDLIAIAGIEIREKHNLERLLTP